MNVGIVALIVVCGWSLLSIAVSVLFGGAARARDARPVDVERELAEARHHHDALHHHRAS